MKPVKQGDVLYCDKCGVEIMVTKSCCCEPCEIICCGKPMQIKKSEQGSCCCSK
ncbi:MAG: hypothetical protein N2201_05900 [candidate division WOR-3 bacterium]|nr:hypothetical protein [candidate division WOR-3 bacterium]